MARNWFKEYADARAFADELSAQGFWVFGTGFVATLFAHALRAAGIEAEPQGYMVTSPEEGQTFAGRPVAALSDSAVDRSALVCIAVHESNLEPVVASLQEQGYENLVWVYPFLYDLIYGEPLFNDVTVPLDYILGRQDPAHHWIAVRALAAAHVDDGDGQAYDCYIKAQSLHCSEATARMRHEKLCALVHSMAARGYDAAYPILVDTSMQVIDGLHRLAVAWLLGIEAIPCTIVAANSAFDVLLTDRNKMTEQQLHAAGLDDAQIGKVLAQTHAMKLGAGPQPVISMVVPAYDVADYMDQCLESVTAQTFGDFEVLLIDDGSTDATPSRCDEWARRDARIIALHKPNGGVSSGRNLGIELARGEYLAFVDPDDWLDERYLEKLCDAAAATDADFVECDIWRYNNRTGKMIHRSCGQSMGMPFTLEAHMVYGPTASYKSLWRRSLWIDNDVRFPDIAFESPAVYALMVALAGERSAYVPEPLYYYRRFRENSLVENAFSKVPGVSDNTLGVEAMDHLYTQFKAHGLYERFEAVMPHLVLWRLNDILAMQYHRRSAEDFAALVANQRAFVERAFPALPRGAYLTWGGYNLNKILQHLPLLNDPSCRFNFSSIAAVALGGETPAKARVSHTNRYRELMLQRELDQVFWDVLAAKQPRFIFMDFIDDRFDLVACGKRWLTCSDAFDGAELAGVELGDRLLFGSEGHTDLWRRAFDAFARRIAQESPGTQLVIVENYLSERVGTLEDTRPFENIEAIRLTNAVLARLYAYARTACPDALWVPAYECADYFTDQAYEYGAVPQHLNEIVNRRIATSIEEVAFNG